MQARPQKGSCSFSSASRRAEAQKFQESLKSPDWNRLPSGDRNNGRKRPVAILGRTRHRPRITKAFSFGEREHLRE